MLNDFIGAFLAMPFAAIEAALFYFLADTFAQYEIGWPLVLAVFFCAHMFWQYRISDSLEEA